MIYSMTFDNSGEIMTEYEMHDVNGGFRFLRRVWDGIQNSILSTILAITTMTVGTFTAVQAGIGGVKLL